MLLAIWISEGASPRSIPNPPPALFMKVLFMMVAPTTMLLRSSAAPWGDILSTKVLLETVTEPRLILASSTPPLVTLVLASKVLSTMATVTLSLFCVVVETTPPATAAVLLWT